MLVMSNTKIDNETPCRRGDERVNLPEVAWAWVVAVVEEERISTGRGVSWFAAPGKIWLETEWGSYR